MTAIAVARPRAHSWRTRAGAIAAITSLVMAAGVVSGIPAAHASSPHVDSKLLLIGQPGGDPTTHAWQAQLANAGVPYTLVTTSGSAGNLTVSLPDLVDPSDANHGLFDSVVITTSRGDFAWGQLLPVWSYEATFGVRQVDGYVFPDGGLGLDYSTGGDLSGTTPILTAAGLATFPALAGPVPFDTGTYGYPSTVDPSMPAGASMTPLLADSSGHVLMGVYQHPTPDWTTLQSGVAELLITFDYTSTSSQWLMLAPGLIDWVTNGAFAQHPQKVDLKVLLIGQPGGDPTTQAWQAQLAGEGVPYTLVSASGSAPNQTVTLPDLVDPSDPRHGLFDGVVLTATRYNFAWPQLSPVWDYESTFGVRQVDGYVFPGSFVGLAYVSGGDRSGTTSTLTAQGRAAFPALKGPVPFDTGTYGYASSVDPSLAPGASVTPLLADASGHVLMDVYQHAATGDPYSQPGVAELGITFDYGPKFLQWMLLAPGLIDWVTNGAHLGLFRNYFGQSVDDVLIPDNSWSSTYHCTPGATNPPDGTCPPGVANNPADTPADQQMTAADADYVATWEHQTGIKLELAFNGVGGCTTTGEAPLAQGCPAGQNPVIDTTHPDDQAFVSELLRKRADFNWVNHTWSHQFLGCTTFRSMPVSTIVANPSGGSLTAGTDTYEVTAATAYGESELSAPQVATVVAGGSVTLTWPDAPHGSGPALWQLEAAFGGGSGFWGYNVYRQLADGTYGRVGAVAEDTSGGTATYSFTDTGAASPGAGPSSTSAYPTATNPGILCTAWDSASHIQIEFDQNTTFAQANGLPNLDPSAVVTGEHSGVENPNMPAAMSASGITSFRADASRQPNQYSIDGSTTSALSAPSYPSNIYYNAGNWADQIDEYNTLYEVGAPNGHCVDTPTNTCITTPATEASILASESRIELGHILGNDPRVGYAHQMNLIGPATKVVGGVTVDSGYTLLRFLDDVLAQYNAWYTVPLTQVTVSSEAQVLSKQSAWQTALSSGDVIAAQSGDIITVTNNSANAVTVPISAPAGSSVDGISLGQHYGATVSSWRTVAPGASLTVHTVGSAPAITSAASTSFAVGQSGSFTVTATGTPPPSLAESGALPSGVTFTDNGDGTATLAGTPGAGTGGTYPVGLSADNGVGSAAQQSFSLTVTQAPAITSSASTTFALGEAGSFTVTATGTPPPSLAESGALPSGVTFTDNGDGTATLAGTPGAGAGGTYPVTITGHNGKGSDATQSFSLTVNQATPLITWATPAPINYGVALSATQLDATSPVPGTFAYSPPLKTVLNAGNRSLSATFTPTDRSRYGTATATVTLVVNQGIPRLTWAKPKAITFGTPLSAAQLKATAKIPGTFTYNPASGVVLSGGTHTLTTTFVPTDAVDYATTTVATTVQVKTAPTSTSLVFTSPVMVGHEDLARFTVTVQSSNGLIPGGTVTVKAGRSSVCSATLNGSAVGTCTLLPSQLKAGTYSVTASYSGSADFTASKSVAGSFIVTAAAALVHGHLRRSTFSRRY